MINHLSKRSNLRLSTLTVTDANTDKRTEQQLTSPSNNGDLRSQRRDSRNIGKLSHRSVRSKQRCLSNIKPLSIFYSNTAGQPVPEQNNFFAVSEVLKNK